MSIRLLMGLSLPTCRSPWPHPGELTDAADLPSEEAAGPIPHHRMVCQHQGLNAEQFMSSRISVSLAELEGTPGRQ